MCALKIPPRSKFNYARKPRSVQPFANIQHKNLPDSSNPPRTGQQTSSWHRPDPSTRCRAGPRRHACGSLGPLDGSDRPRSAGRAGGPSRPPHRWGTPAHSRVRWTGRFGSLPRRFGRPSLLGDVACLLPMPIGSMLFRALLANAFLRVLRTGRTLVIPFACCTLAGLHEDPP